ncbi:cytochrome P450 [Cerioporus squamosus]|nr:cytochrome P450 [Cerioporus squamosus]
MLSGRPIHLDVPASVLAVSAVALAILLCRRWVSSRIGLSLSLPPGPRPCPVIGNLLDVPVRDMEVRFRDMNSQYGDVVYLNAFGQHMVILGTHEAATELLEKRASNYSDRKFSSMAELTGLSWLLSSVRYGDRWRAMRRDFHQHMNAKAVSQYRSIHEREVKNFLVRLLENPTAFSNHGRSMFGAVIMRIVYGLEVGDNDDEYIHTAEEAITAFNVTFTPGKYLVETFPIMRFIPRWFPGAKFRREAAAWRPAVFRMRDLPWEAAVEAMREGKAVPSMVTDLKDRVETSEEEEIAKDTAASVYLGASDTTLSTLQTFFAAMATYPEVQKRAQAELDTVVGLHRLPTIDDEKLLPYISAIIKECLRWKLVTPLGVAHMSSEEDEYNGYRIPKGSVVIPNIWAYSRDLRHYADPEEFKPERFLKDGQLDHSVLDPSVMAFGYGRRRLTRTRCFSRICPGKLFAQSTLFTLLSSILHTYWISLPTDESGNHVPLSMKMTPGVISYVHFGSCVVRCLNSHRYFEPFDCGIKPRSPEAEKLIRTLQDEQKIAEDVGVEG